MTEHAKPELTSNQQWADTDLAKTLVPQREFGTHKWGVGGVVIVAGSPNYTGAAQLCSRAAGRAGAGIVYLAAPRLVISTIASAIPEVAHLQLPSTDSATGVRNALETLEDPFKKSRAVVVGPGLGDEDGVDQLLSALFGIRGTAKANSSRIGFPHSTKTSVANGSSGIPLLSNDDATVVIDADGLNWLAKQDEWWKRLPEQRCILTPHPGEMSRLLDKDDETITYNPLKTVEEAARKWKQTVVLKYGYTAASNGERTIIAQEAPVSLATAGSGDVFAGMIGAFAAQGLEPIDAAALALHVGPRAARRGEQRFGAFGLLSTDLPDAIALELATLTDE